MISPSKTCPSIDGFFSVFILDSFYIATFFFFFLQQLSTSVQFIIQWTLTKETIPLFSIFQTMYLCRTSSLLPVTLRCFACTSTDCTSLQNVLSQMLVLPDSVHCLRSLDLLKLLQFMHLFFFFLFFFGILFQFFPKSHLSIYCFSVTSLADEQEK